MLTQMALTIARFRFGHGPPSRARSRQQALPTAEDGCANALGFNQTEGCAAPRRRHDTRAASNQLQRFVFHAFAISQSLSNNPVMFPLNWVGTRARPWDAWRRMATQMADCRWRVSQREDVIQTFPELQWRWSSGLPPL